MSEQIFGVSVVGLIFTISTLALQVGFPKKYLPLLSLLLGILGGFVVYYPDWQHAIVTGLAMGLAPTGLFSGVKNIREGAQDTFSIE